MLPTVGETNGNGWFFTQFCVKYTRTTWLASNTKRLLQDINLRALMSWINGW